jgi:amino acid permease
LQGFTLEGFDETGRRVFTFIDTLPDVLAVYTVIPSNVTSLISLVNITVVNDEQILQICEVEIYGGMLFIFNIIIISTIVIIIIIMIVIIIIIIIAHHFDLHIRQF